MLGVYLPTIQHILGVTMFIRLFWVVGIAELGQTFLLLFLCCLCVSNLSTRLFADFTNFERSVKNKGLSVVVWAESYALLFRS